MLRAAVLAVDGVSAFDLATPIEVLGRARTAEGETAYDVVLAGPEETAQAGPTTITVPHGLDELVGADLVLVPGRSDPDVPLPDEVVSALRCAAWQGARIASICIGAYDLASTGLLDGLKATTHWRHTARLAARFPEVEVVPTAVFVDNGQILTSAGAAAGIDLCLHLVSRDYGGLAAAESARVAVMPLTRSGRQTQYVRDDPLGGRSITATLEWIEEHAGERITVADIADSALVSVRTLNRRFAEQLGVTPNAWLIRTRVRNAQRLLETTDWTLARIATVTGLGSVANLRTHFIAALDATPSRYRSALLPTAPGAASAPRPSAG